MYELRHTVNLIHYNIWRFERWTRRLVFGDGKMMSIREELEERPGGPKLDDIAPFAGYAVNEADLPNYSGKHFSILIFLLFITALNFFCAAFNLDFKVFWFWGMIASVIPALIIDHYLTPLPWRFNDGVPTGKNQLLEDFKTFETMSVSDKRKSGLVTLLVVIAIWAGGVFSFVYYLGSLIALKK